jgi:hypothetical protein
LAVISGGVRFAGAGRGLVFFLRWQGEAELAQQARELALFGRGQAAEDAPLVGQVLGGGGVDEAAALGVSVIRTPRRPGASHRAFSKSLANPQQTCGGRAEPRQARGRATSASTTAAASRPLNPEGPTMSLTFIRSAAGAALLAVLAAGCGTAATAHHAAAKPAAAAQPHHSAAVHAPVTTPASRPATIAPATTAPAPATTAPAPATTAPAPATTAPAPATTAPASPANPIPQGNGGDHDPDNNGGPSDGDGNL